MSVNGCMCWIRIIYLKSQALLNFKRACCCALRNSVYTVGPLCTSVTSLVHIHPTPGSRLHPSTVAKSLGNHKTSVFQEYFQQHFHHLHCELLMDRLRCNLNNMGVYEFHLLKHTFVKNFHNDVISVRL